MCYVFLEEITKWVDDGSPVDVIYLDFQKAFDKVPNQRLIIHSSGVLLVLTTLLHFFLSLGMVIASL